MSNPSSTPDPANPTSQTAAAHPDKLTYGSYLKIPELLSLQRPLTDHRDELLFIQAHQVYELWFKQMLHEMQGVCDYLDHDQALRAAQLLERIHRIQHLLTEQIPVLETMFSVEFARFRSSLGTSSGFQSVQFRRIEFLCGNKNPKMLALVGEDEAAKAEMAAYLARPTPYDHFIRHLAREDNGIFKVPTEALAAAWGGARDTSLPHEENQALVTSLEILYREQGGGHKGERYFAQFRVAEALLEFDHRFAIWRFHHVKMVERMIGAMTGTGGSSGAKYLAATVQRGGFWPDLLAVRSRLGGAYGSTPPSR